MLWTYFVPSQIPLFVEYASASQIQGDSSATQAPLPTGSPDQSTLALCVLGSGSGGNCSVIECAGQLWLIDAGLGPRTVAKRLRQVGGDFSRIQAVLLTHLDRDHFRPSWIASLVRQHIRLYVHRQHAGQLQSIPGVDQLTQAGLIEWFNGQPHALQTRAGWRLNIHTVHLPHDRRGATGFRIDTPVGSIGYATDLGAVPAQLVERLAGVDLLAIESNYDPDMQRQSGRPLFLQYRIVGGRGHLSNKQCFEAVRAIFNHGEDDQAARPPQAVVLLHRSRQCNCPRLMQRVFDADQRIGPKVVIADQKQPTPWLTIQPNRTEARKKQR